MSQQTIKQRARRQALDVAAKRRRARAVREKRLEDLAVQVMTAVGERDSAVAETERRAGAALREMTEAGGLTLREAVQWCGEEITVREATRLRQLAGSDGEAASEPGQPSECGEAVEGAANQAGGYVPVRGRDESGRPRGAGRGAV